jgi:hypothetical protein
MYAVQGICVRYDHRDHGAGNRGGATAGCGAQEATLQPEAQGPTLSGLTLLNDRCTECHTLDRVKSASKTREGWQETVTAMVQRGADLDEQEQEVLVDYLAQVYGP